MKLVLIVSRQETVVNRSYFLLGYALAVFDPESLHQNKSDYYFSFAVKSKATVLAILNLKANNFQSGYYLQQRYYQSFQPSQIDRVWSLDNMELIQLLGRSIAIFVPPAHNLTPLDGALTRSVN